MSHDQSARIVTIPNLLSIFRIILLLPISYFVWYDKLKIVAILILFSFCSDYLDGIIARRFNQMSDLGKILDPLGDKLSIGVVLIILNLKGSAPLWLVLIVVGRDLIILLVGTVLASKYRLLIHSNFIGKVTVNLLSFMMIGYIFNIRLMRQIFTPLAVAFIFFSSYSYLKRILLLVATGELKKKG